MIRFAAQDNFNGLLLDTNIVTYLSSENTWRPLYAPLLIGRDIYISFMTLAELWESVCHRGLGRQKIDKTFEQLRRDVILIPFCEVICENFGKIRSERRNRPISVPDALIAATALSYDLPLVTHNKSDFEGITGLEIVTKYE